MKKITSKKNLLILLITASSIIGNFLININTAQAYDICAITLRNGSQGQQKAASIYPNGEQPNNPPYWVFKEGASSVQIVAETDYCVGKKITLNLYEEDGWGVKNDNEIDINDEKGNAWDGIITVPSTGAFTINLTANEEFCDNNWGFDCHWYFTLETVDGNDYDSLGKDGGDLYTECDGVCDFAVGDDTNFIYKGITENTRTTPIAPEHWYYKKVNQNATGNINGGHDNSKAYLNGIFPSLIECKKAATVALGREAIDTDCIKDGDPYPISPQSVYSDKEYNDGTTGVTPPVSGVEVGSVKITPYNGDYNLLAPIGDLTVIKGSKEGEPADPNNSIGGYLNTIFKIAIGLMGALAVIMIVIHGVQYMGDESVFGKTEAKHSIMTTIGGLLLALCAYALLNTINPDLLGGDGVSIDPVNISISANDTSTGSSTSLCVSKTNPPNPDAAQPTSIDLREPAKTKYLNAQKTLNFSTAAKLLITAQTAMEGFSANTLSYKTNNPGNIGNTDDGKTRSFPTLEDGIKAQLTYLQIAQQGNAKGSSYIVGGKYDCALNGKYDGSLYQYLRIYSTGARKNNNYVNAIIGYFKQNGKTITARTKISDIYKMQ